MQDVADKVLIAGSEEALPLPMNTKSQTSMSGFLKQISYNAIYTSQWPSMLASTIEYDRRAMEGTSHVSPSGREH